MEKKIVIIGGGVVGMSTAFHLANKGIRDITIIEKDIASIFEKNRIVKIDVRRGYGPSLAADAKEIHMNMHVF